MYSRKCCACSTKCKSQKEDKIRDSNFEHVPRKLPSEDPEEDDRKPA